MIPTALSHCSSSTLTLHPPPTPEVGYISGVHPATSASGGRCRSSTYELRAARGQRWNISLLDFTAAPATTSADTGTGNGNMAEREEARRWTWTGNGNTEADGGGGSDWKWTENGNRVEEGGEGKVWERIGNGKSEDGAGWKRRGAVCRRYAVVREQLNSVDRSSESGYSDEAIVCGGTVERQRTVFLSQTEHVRLEVQTRADDQTEDRFLLQFAG